MSEKLSMISCSLQNNEEPKQKTRPERNDSGGRLPSFFWTSVKATLFQMLLFIHDV